MAFPEVELPPGLRYLRNAFAIVPFRSAASRQDAWSVIERSAEKIFGTGSGRVLQHIRDFGDGDIKKLLQPGMFQNFIVLVGEQGSGKETMAVELARRNFYKLTMSDIVRAVAPELGFDPATTQGKIDAGHALRRLFNRSVIMNLSMLDARTLEKEKIVVDGPRSMYEVRAAKNVGARIVGLIAHEDRKKDRAIRFERVIQLRPQSEIQRTVLPADFFSRERQERSRTRRMLAVADTIIVTNRKAADLVDGLLKLA